MQQLKRNIDAFTVILCVQDERWSFDLLSISGVMQLIVQTVEGTQHF